MIPVGPSGPTQAHPSHAHSGLPTPARPLWVPPGPAPPAHSGPSHSPPRFILTQAPPPGRQDVNKPRALQIPQGAERSPSRVSAPWRGRLGPASPWEEGTGCSLAERPTRNGSQLRLVSPEPERPQLGCEQRGPEGWLRPAGVLLQRPGGRELACFGHLLLLVGHFPGQSRSQRVSSCKASAMGTAGSPTAQPVDADLIATPRGLRDGPRGPPRLCSAARPPLPRALTGDWPQGSWLLSHSGPPWQPQERDAGAQGREWAQGQAEGSSRPRQAPPPGARVSWPSAESPPYWSEAGAQSPITARPRAGQAWREGGESLQTCFCTYVLTA